MNNEIVIIGGAAGSKIVYEIFELSQKKVIGFMNNFVKEKDWANIPKKNLGNFNTEKNKEILNTSNVDYFVATGDNKMREEVVDEIYKITNKYPINAIHPSSKVSKYAKIGYGNLLCAGCFIDVGCNIKNCTIINNHAIIAHDCLIEDYSQIASGASLGGYVTIKKYSFVGIGASIMPNTKVGYSSVVGIGSGTVRNVDDNSTVIGVPARKIL